MIVISGALAVVAFVLLIAGLVADGLGLVYASIAVSLVSAIFLGVGAFQRRGEEVATERPATPTPSPSGALARSSAAGSATDFDDGESTVRIADPVTGSGTSAGSVLVVPGRPRYHVEGCRYLAGKDGETRSLAEARNEGYTACGICRPDENLAAPAPALVGGGAGGRDDGDGAGDDAEDDAAAKPAHTESTPSTTRRATARPTARRTPARSTPAKKTAAKKSTPTATKKTAAKKTATKTTAKKTAAKKSAATKATAKKATAKKSTAKKSAAKKTAAKKSARRR